MDSAVKKARSEKAKEIIKCHPEGKDGGIIPLKALQQLKPGMTLVLLPAQYWDKITIPQDRVTVTTEGKKIHYSIELTGRNAVVNNVNCKAITVLDDSLILDSVADEIIIGSWGYESRIKLKTLIYNTAFNNLRTLGGENNTYSLEIKNCLSKGPLAISSNTNKATITDSILMSDDYVFSFTELWNTKKGRLLLKNNLIYGKVGYARMEDSPSEKKRAMTVLDPADLRKIWSTSLSGEQIYEKPKFQTEEQLFLTEDSPGKGRGLIPEEHPMFEVIKKIQEDVHEKDDPDVKKEPGDNELSDRNKRRKERIEKWRKEHEKRMKEREERNKESNNDNEDVPEKDPLDDDGLGGVPTPPE